MPVTQQQACEFLRVPPAMLDLYVAQGRLHPIKARTIRGRAVSFDEAELEALKRTLQEEQERIRSNYEAARSSYKSVEAEIFDSGADSTNGRKSSISPSESVMERLLFLLEALTPSSHPTVAVENKLILTLTEAAVYSGLSEGKLIAVIQAGNLKARKDLGRGYRIKRSDLEAYIESL